jgi:3-oxoacyl-[acyl-carrier protein] reductase
MDLGIHGRVAIVTGGSRGLGRSAALSLAREGVRVAICARNPEDLHRTVQELRDLGAEAMGVVADVTHPEGPEKVYRETLERYGQVDILVNNLGGRRGGQSLEDTTEQDFLDALMLNLFSAIRLTRLALPEMRRRRWGRIINIASIWGREYGGTIAYMTAKAALIAFTKGLARQVAKDNVLVNSVAPGSILFPGGGWDRFIRTNPPEVVEEFIARNLPMGRFGWPEPVGDLVAFLASERASLITGACINIDGGQSYSLI